MPYMEITIQTDPLQQEILQGYLYTFPIGGLVINDPRDRQQVKDTAPEWVVVDDDVLGDLSDPITIQLFVERNDAPEVLAALQKHLSEYPEQGQVTGTRQVDEESWADSWKQYFKPLPVGEKLLIKPTWENVEDTGRTILSIDPGMAFGSGTHETTQLCLEQLEQLSLQDARVADIGCGSGILSIAAALFGAADVQAVDIEPMSIRMTEENAEINGVKDIIRAREGSLLDGVEAPVDFVVSNILAEILVRMIPDLDPVLAPAGTVIFSGIIEEKKDLVAQALTAHGYAVVREKTDGGWVVLMAERTR